MLTAFLTTLVQMARILLFLALGFALNRLHILPKGAGTGISRLVTTVFLPAMLLHSNMTEFNLADVSSYGQLVLLGAIFWALGTLLSLPVAKKLSGGDSLERGVHLYGLSFPNSSAVGSPLALSLLGTNGLFQFNLFLLPFVVMTYAWGVNLFLEGERKHPVKRFFVNLFNPIFCAMTVGLLLGALGSKNWMPSIITGLVGQLGDCFVPVSLLMTGYTIADYPLGEVFHRPKSYVFTLIRLIVIPVFLLSLAWFMNLSCQLATLIVFVCAGPSGMNVVVFPAAYGKDCRTGAGNVLLSCLGSILTIPLLYALVQQVFG